MPFDALTKSIEKTFITDDRYILFLDGFKNTITIAVFATIIGVAIGIIVAIIKVYCKNTGKLKALNFLATVYTTIIRGTPVVVQLMILYYLVFISVRSGVLIAIIGFGINSGAYVAEIIRAGIQSIDKGQSEAGRSLGLSEATTMRYVILPQAIKNVLPALFNEFITLLKETSIAGYITVMDLTKAADLVRARTLDALFPLLLIAAVYLVLVIGLTFLQHKLEKRLGQSDRR
jgi:His/Glu/Gln/Arg/opine family amino acid ABC transporter permease subunit